MINMLIKYVGIILSGFILNQPFSVQAQDKMTDAPIRSIYLLASNTSNGINFFSIQCENAKYGDQKIFCTSFNISIGDKLTEKEKKGENLGENLKAAIKEIREGASDFCTDRALAHFDRFISIYDRVKSGEEVRVPGKILTKKMLEDQLSVLKNDPRFRQFGEIDFLEDVFRKIRFLCKDNAVELQRLFESAIIKGFENEKRTAKVHFWPWINRQEYKKDIETGNFYFEKNRKNECFRYYQRDEIRFNKNEFVPMAVVDEYEETTAIVDMLRSDAECMERAKKYPNKIIWRAGQSFELPSHWKFLEVSK